jgi:heme A synthase
MHLNLMNNPWLHRFAVAVALCTLLLVAAGGVAAGGAAHRAMAGSAGALTVVLAVWTARAQSRRWVRRTAWAAALAVGLQGALGSLAVRSIWPLPVAIAHTILAETCLILTVSLAIVLAPEWNTKVTPNDGRTAALPGWAAAATVLLASQGALGASVRYSALDVVPHVAVAVAATAAAIWAAGKILLRHMDCPALRRPALWTLSLTCSQVFLGLGALLGRATGALPWFSAAHIVAGALAVAASTVMTIRAFQTLRRPRGEEGMAAA